MIGRRLTGLLASLAAAGLLTACEGNPTAPPEEHDDELTVELEIAPGHLHILQTEVQVTVRVTDHHGEPVTDFEAIQVERLAEGSDTWGAIELARAGTAYVGTYTFTSSGDYQLRVMGQRPGEAEMMLLHQVHDPLHVARAHAETGGYRVEFETFPGHIHEGDDTALRFWIMEPEGDEAGNRPPIAGVVGEVHVVESDGSELGHALLEMGDGVYECEHTFQTADEAHVRLHFTGADGEPAEAEFHLHVAHGH